MTAVLLHLVPGDDPAVEGTGPYEPRDVPVGGGLVCADADTAAGLARLLHAGAQDLRLVVIDPRRLTAAEIEHRDVYGIGRTLPVVTGTIPRAAVVEVVPFPPGPGGRWSRPDVPPLA